MTDSVRRLPLLLAAVFVLALALRLGTTTALIGLSAPPKGDANPDQLDYELFAAQMAAGNGYSFGPGRPTACRPPGTSFALVPVYAVAGHSYPVARVWWCVLSAVTCVVTWWAAYPVFGHRVGLLAAAVVAVYPGHLYYAMHFLSEVPASLALALGTGLAVRAGPRPGWRDFVAGAVWGFAILVRPNLVLAFAPVGLVMAWAAIGWRNRAARLALLAAGSLVVVGPWVARNHAVVGKAGVCTIVGGYTFWGANNRLTYNDPAYIGYWVATSELESAEQPIAGTEVEKEAASWAYGKQYLTDHASELPRVVMHRVLRVVWAYTETTNRTADLAFRFGWLALLPFVAVGLWRAFRVVPVPAMVFVAPLAATLATAVVFYGCGRFRDTCAPQLATFAAVGVFWLVTRRTS